MDEINYYLKENNLNTDGGMEYVAVVEQSLMGYPVHTDLFRTGISIKGGSGSYPYGVAESGEFRRRGRFLTGRKKNSLGAKKVFALG